MTTLEGDMESKYGHVCPLFTKNYIDGLSGRIFKLLPLREEGCTTIPKNIESICCELNGFLEYIPQPSITSNYVMAIISILTDVSDEEDFAVYRREILRCRKMMSRVGDLVV